ncbi:MAG: glucosyl-3-phosphoglycerate synthase [Lentisphaerae bacterium]|nr:glucosyl-3-phosphoglycerate synthase [Lentisphaerota bacterium]
MKAPQWFKRLVGRAPARAVRRLPVADWLSGHTFHHSQFADLKALVLEKERQHLRISLCLPALNEEKTIGKEIILLKAELMTRYPLLDELCVIDSGSTDQTREIAAAYGAKVYLAREILPQYGEKKGKGENLWKALYQLRGDIIIYIDADVSNIRPHFAYGLVGPLIRNPEVKYVKAFYDRPLTLSKGVRVSGGGRVTEILVRPLFSLFFPELTAIIQPLSGEYAARRCVLEQLPFPIGYGVETAHLLDIYQRWGMAALAQTDLDQRIHRNQSTHALGKMAFGIFQIFFRRAQAYGWVNALPAMETVLRQFQQREGHYEQIESPISEEERPAIITIPEYQRAFKRYP